MGGTHISAELPLLRVLDDCVPAARERNPEETDTMAQLLSKIDTACSLH